MSEARFWWVIGGVIHGKNFKLYVAVRTEAGVKKKIKS